MNRVVPPGSSWFYGIFCSKCFQTDKVRKKTGLPSSTKLNTLPFSTAPLIRKNRTDFFPLFFPLVFCSAWKKPNHLKAIKQEHETQPWRGASPVHPSATVPQLGDRAGPLGCSRSPARPLTCQRVDFKTGHHCSEPEGRHAVILK